MSSLSTRLASTLLPVSVLLVAMASIQSGASLAKTLFPEIGAQGTTTLRLVFAAIILALVLRPWRARISKASLRPLIMYGLALGGMNLLFYMSLRSIPLGIAVALEFTGPLAVALFASRRAIDFIWIGLAALGLWLLLPLGKSEAHLDLTGVAYALGAGVCWALYIVYGARAGSDHGMQGAALGVLVAAIFVAPFGIAHAGADLLRPELLPVALGVALLSTAIPYSLEMIALTRLPAQTFGTLMSIEPAFGALSGLIFLGEHLSVLQWLAILCIILASIGCTVTATPRQQTQPLVAPD